MKDKPLEEFNQSILLNWIRSTLNLTDLKEFELLERIQEHYKNIREEAIDECIARMPTNIEVFADENNENGIPVNLDFIKQSLKQLK